MKVFYVNSFGYDAPVFGESTLERTDKDYVKVDGQLMNAAFVWPATDENLAIYHDFARAIKAWREQEPNIFITLNRMKRV